MRLWHQDLISKLPRQQLLGQHRECCALRGNGWGKKHSVVDYVFQHSPEKLFYYHTVVMDEMKNRGYVPDSNWRNAGYRGKQCEPYDFDFISKDYNSSEIIYPEHDKNYLEECLDNLQNKGYNIGS